LWALPRPDYIHDIMLQYQGCYTRRHLGQLHYGGDSLNSNIDGEHASILYFHRVTTGTVTFGEHCLQFRYRRHPEMTGTVMLDTDVWLQIISTH